jgi:hypothetical protein
LIREEANSLLDVRGRQGVQPDRLLALRKMVNPLGQLEDFLTGSLDAVEFQSVFTREWVQLHIGLQHGPEIERLRHRFSQFYDLIHFYIADPEVRQMDPLLLDEVKLLTHTREAFAELRAGWFQEACR